MTPEKKDRLKKDPGKDHSRTSFAPPTFVLHMVYLYMRINQLSRNRNHEPKEIGRVNR